VYKNICLQKLGRLQITQVRVTGAEYLTYWSCDAVGRISTSSVYQISEHVKTENPSICEHRITNANNSCKLRAERGKLHIKAAFDLPFRGKLKLKDVEYCDVLRLRVTNKMGSTSDDWIY
jgi:hypothetical protein